MPSSLFPDVSGFIDFFYDFYHLSLFFKKATIMIFMILLIYFCSQGVSSLYHPPLWEIT